MQHNRDDDIHCTHLAWQQAQLHVDHLQTLAALSMVGPEMAAVYKSYYRKTDISSTKIKIVKLLLNDNTK